MNQSHFKKNWGKMTREEIRRAQGEQLHRFLRDNVVPYSAFYRDLFEKNKLSPDQFHAVEDLQRLPFIDKTTLMTTPEHPLRMRDFALLPDKDQLAKTWRAIRGALLHGREATRQSLMREYRPVFLTSTTGRSAEPVSFLYTQYDLDNLTLAGNRIIEVLGANQEDRILNMFPYSPHLAFWQTHHATTYSTIFCISTGGGKVMGTEGNIRLLNKVKPTSLIGMPTFLYHMLNIALEEGKTCESLRMLILGGEKVPEGMRQKLREMALKLGAKQVDVLATYGFTEAKAAWVQCPYPHDQAPSGYHLTPDLSIIEIVDPDTGAVQPDGAPGEIVYSAIDARGTVVMRYRTGDFIDGGLVYDACPYCKRSVPRLMGNISRKSNRMELRLDKIKGTLIDFNELEHALDDFKGIGAWQIELRKTNDDELELDELILHAEKASTQNEEDLVREINDRFCAITELRLNEVEFHDAAEMRRRQGVGTELKERRIVDNRPHDGKPAPPRVRVERRVRPHQLSQRRTESL
jgi:phenylacetate-CoA ligase